MNLRNTSLLPCLLLLSLPALAGPPASRLTGIALPTGAVQLQNPGALARMKAGFGAAVGKPVGDLEFFAWSGGKPALRDQIAARLKAAGYTLVSMPNLAAPGIQAFSISRNGKTLYEIWSRDSTLADVTFFRTGAGGPPVASVTPPPVSPAAVPTPTLTPSADGKSWAAKGYSALTAKKYQAASTDYLKALAAEPHNAEYLYNLGVAVDGLKHYKSAADAYRTAIYLKPDILDARTNLGIDLIHLKKYAEAIKYLQEATIRQPNDALTFRSLGDAYYNAGQNKLAAAAYRGALRLAPNDATTYKYLGDSLGNLGKTDEAIAAYSQAIHLDPSLRAVAVKSPTAVVVANAPDSATPTPNNTVPTVVFPPVPDSTVPVVNSPSTPDPGTPTVNPPSTPDNTVSAVNLPALPTPTPSTDTAPVVANAGPPPPGSYRCTWTHLDLGEINPKSDYMGSFTLKADGTYTWMDGAEPGTYAYDAATQEITFTGGHLGRDGVKARLHWTRTSQPLIFVSFSTDYTRSKGKSSVLWTCVPADPSTVMPQ